MARRIYKFVRVRCVEEDCGHEFDKFMETTDVVVPCIKCGGPAARPELVSQVCHAVIGDELDYIDHNLGKEPIRIRSRAERKRLMKENGRTEFIRHTPIPGTDQSPFTTDWSRRIDPYTLRNARLLVERVYGPGASAPGIVVEPDPEPVANAFSFTVTREELNEILTGVNNEAINRRPDREIDGPGRGPGSD